MGCVLTQNILHYYNARGDGDGKMRKRCKCVQTHMCVVRESVCVLFE